MDYIRSSIFYHLDVSWIVLIIAGIFMVISSIITISVLCLLWRRHRIPITMNDHSTINHHHQSQNYETQKMEIFVPQDDEDTTQRNLGVFHARVTPQDGIQQMHQFYPRMNKAYF